MACHFNRINVVRHLLQAQCDPCRGPSLSPLPLLSPGCSFLDSIERRPLHLAASCGHGEVAQLLLDFKADPLEDDENRERPVFKLAKALEGKAQALQARVYELEALLQATPKPTTSPKRGGKRCGGGPVLLKRYAAWSFLPFDLCGFLAKKLRTPCWTTRGCDGHLLPGSAGWMSCIRLLHECDQLPANEAYANAK